MRALTTFKLVFLTTLLNCQINFEYPLKDSSTYAKCLLANEGILSGEFGEIHSLLVIEDGNLVFENYYESGNKDSLHQMQSITKSVVATLFGCALQNNFISNEFELISKYYSDLVANDSIKMTISIADLLTQRHGFLWKEGLWNDTTSNWSKILQLNGNWYQAILNTPMTNTPGTTFNYSNAAPILVSGIIQKASGMSIDSFANKYLFTPLDITTYRFWQGNGGPKNNGLTMIFLTSRDMAKIGQLYLQKGKWNDIQLIPESFVDQATSPIVKQTDKNGFYNNYGYGYFWWNNPETINGRKLNIYLARGAGGQNIIVSKEKKLVIAITAWNTQRPNKVQTIYETYFDTL